MAVEKAIAAARAACAALLARAEAQRVALEAADKLAAEVEDKMTGRVSGLIVDACAAYRAARGA
jgi:hypothetical protein